MREIRVLNLGAGVQSTTIYLLNEEWRLGIDYAVFADTGEEPLPVYKHLEWLKGLGGPPIIVANGGVKLGDQLISGKRTVSIPAFLKGGRGRGRQRRQCTRDFKVRVVERTIRREICGLKPRKRVPSDTKIIQYIGFSVEEIGRMRRMEKLLKRKQWDFRFPLIERGWSRRDCVEWLKGKVPHEVPKSACVFCPYRSNEEWRWLKERDPRGWDRAVQIDEALRSGAAASKGMQKEMFVHPSLVPLRVLDLKKDSAPLWFIDCVGACGT